MKRKSFHRLVVWTACLIAGAGLFLAAQTAAADPAADAAAKPKAASTQPAAQPAKTSAQTLPTTRVICLQNSVRCFSARPGPPGDPNVTPRALDLSAPAITRVFTQAELSQKIQDEDPYDYTETVQVEGERQMQPVSIGIMAIPWAIIHPTQAWRILMPVPDAK